MLSHKPLLVMLVVLAFPDQETALTQQLCTLLTDEHGRFPSRRTWERRLKVLPDDLPGMIGTFGRYLVCLMQPWAELG